MTTLRRPVFSFAVLRSPSLLAGTAILLALALSACGDKKAPPAAPAEASQPDTPSATPAAPESSQPAAPSATAPAAPTPSTESAPAAATSRNSADTATWQRWDRAAERLRDVGLTVRESSNPLRLEVEIATSRVTGAEAMTIAKTAYANLGGGDAVVTVYDEAGKRVAEASLSGVRGRE